MTVYYTSPGAGKTTAFKPVSHVKSSHCHICELGVNGLGTDEGDANIGIPNARRGPHEKRSRRQSLYENAELLSLLLWPEF